MERDLRILVLLAATLFAPPNNGSVLFETGFIIARGQRPSLPITLLVDATEAPRKIFHARETIPASAGPLTLVYPKWIPGEHGPTGPITDLAGLKLTAAGKSIQWQRDKVDMYAFHCEVPPGASAIEASFDFLSPASTAGFSSAASATAQLAVISWNQLLLYPQGAKPAELNFSASLRLPPNWRYGTALPVAKESEVSVEFRPVPMETLIDSPVITGMYLRVVPLTPNDGLHEIDMASDSAAALEMSPELRLNYQRLVAEAGALFGAHHYQRYHFLLTLSDFVAHFGLEHHESSDDRVAERSIVDPDKRVLMADLLPHEFVHSWNGKYRRPANLTTPDYQQPMETDLVWVYEGLTEYLGSILTARSGLWTAEQYRQHLALIAAGLDHRAGRTWRPLIDTTVAAQLLYEARGDWASWRRGVDFYDEGELIWLEADTIIRQKTNGQRSLDDFCRLFHGGQTGPPTVKTYTFEDVVAALNQVAPQDWRAFLTTRLTSTSPRAPLGGVEGGGWRLVYTDTLPDLLRARQDAAEMIDLNYSMGLTIRSDENTQGSAAIIDVIPGLPAAEAGIGPGMKLVAVNGRRWSPEVLREAVRGSKSSQETLDLLVENNSYFKTYRLNYHGGERYPHLERDQGRPDLLTQIIKPLK